jgi:MSHA pilin protein MshD
MSTDARKDQHGFTLVEAVIAIMIVSVAIAGVISVFVVGAQHSGDPMARVQAQIIGEGYLNEILLKRFYDTTTSKVCPAGAPSHASYVCGYNGLSESPVTGYTANVTVTSSGVTLGSLDNSSVIRVLRVDVAVSTPNGETLTFTGYRANYECNATGDSGCVPLT